MEISFGDLIEVKTKDKVFVGRLMERPEIIKGNYLVIKLENGYNIGISREKIIEIKLIEKYKKKEEKIEIEKKSNLPTITLISTGGTISSKVDYATGGVIASLEAANLVNWVKELRSIANFETKAIMQKMSEDMEEEDWIKMAREVYKEIKKEEVKGVIITHGTDTMHFSTAALSFLLEKLNKPVIFTGAQRSSDRPSSDAYLNILFSSYLAKEDFGEVALVMHSSIEDKEGVAHVGTRVRKLHTSRRDAFKSVTTKPLALISRNGKVKFLLDKRKDEEVRLFDKLEKKVGLIYTYPGMSEKIIDFFIDNDYKGLVIAGTGLGHTPLKLVNKIKEATDKGIVVAITSQCIYGATHPFVYSTLRKLSIKANALFLYDMLTEVAYIKLKYAIAKANKVEDVKKIMITNLKREFTYGVSNGEI